MSASINLPFTSSLSVVGPCDKELQGRVSGRELRSSRLGTGDRFPQWTPRCLAGHQDLLSRRIYCLPLQQSITMNGFTG